MRNDVINALKSVSPGAEPGSFKAEFCFDPALPVFQGHFPGRPLLPGVVQIEMVRYATDVFTGARHDIVRVKKAKFSGEIVPGRTITMEAQTSADADSANIKATLRVGETEAATISMVLKRGAPVTQD